VIDKDPSVLSAVFGRTNEATFDSFYNQFLPDYAGGIFQGVALGARNVMRAQAEEVTDMPRDEPRSWLQEVGSGVSQKSATEINYRTTGFGIAGGYEVPFGSGNGVVGLSAAYLSSDVRNQDRSVTSFLDVNSFLVGGYWRDRRGNLLLDASVNGGYLWVNSDRQVIDQATNGVRNIQKDVLADWTGFLATGRLGAAYDWQTGALYLRPDVFIDYVYLREGGYTETGGRASIDLQVDGRSSYQAAAEVGVAFGARFGRTFRWGPEIRVGYRTTLAGGLADTTARFASVPGTPFTLSSIEQDKSVMVVMAGLRGSGAYSNFALEAGGEIGDLYRAYMARLVVRFLF
jgi:outer membrane autotransporter protein